MSISAQQYLNMRAMLRLALSGNYPGQANPSDGEVLGFMAQLFTDSAGAAVLDFWQQLITDSSGASALAANRYKALRSVLRDSMSNNYPGTINPSDSDLLSYFGNVSPITPLFAAGGYWNLATLVAADDSLITSPIASLVGANTLTPGTRKPIVRNNSVRGMPAIYFEQVPANGFNTLSCDALASTFRSSTGSWTIVFKVRPDKANAAPTLFSLTRSDGNATESMHLRQNLGVWTLRKTTAVGGTTNLVATTGADPYSDTYVAVTCNAGVVTLFLRESGKTTEGITSPGSLEVTNLSASVDRVGIMGTAVAALAEGFSGYLGGVAIATSALTNAQVHSAIDQLAGSDYYGAQTAAVGALLTGSSLTLGTTDSITSAGVRDTFAELCVSEALEYYTFGDTGSAGPGRQKNKNAFTSSAGSATDPSILGMVTRAVANSPVPIRFWYAELGTALNNLNTAPATICSTVVADFTTGMNALLAADSRAFAAIPNITPVDVSISGGLTAANATACHTIWQAQVVAPLQAAFPGRVFYHDAYLAYGGVWSAQLFADTTGHPNRAGYVQQSLHPQYGLLQAVNELGETLVHRIRAEAKKAAKPPTLTATIDSPIADGTPVNTALMTFIASTSRVGAKCVLKRDGVTVGTMSALELYDTNLASSDYSKKPHYQNSYTYDATLESGTHAFTVVATDTDGTTTATSAAINLTFAAVVPLSTLTAVPLRALYYANQGVTESSGVATAMLDQSGTGNHLAFNVDGPTIVKSDSTLGNRRTLQLATGTELFRSPSIASIAPPFTLYYVCRPDNWVNGAPMVNIQGQAADTGGAPNVSMFNGSYVNATQETVGEWAVYRLRFTNSAADSIKIGSRSAVTGANAGNQSIAAIRLNFGGGRAFAFRSIAIFGGAPSGAEETAIVASLVADAAGIPTS